MTSADTRTRTARLRLSAVGLGLTLASVLGASAPVRAESDRHVESGADAQLAERYAPIIMVQRQDSACGDGEPFAPASVDSVLDQPGVVLRGPDESIVREQPTAADLGSAGPDTYLDLPGNALSPGCDYERWFKSTGSDQHPTTYARIATDSDHPDQIALQYWLFWVYNDWNDRHEGDWEMLQIVFNARSADEALSTTPVEVNVAQHEGSERRAWSDVQRHGDRPVVFPGTGSHATYYSAHRWFGKSAASGFGCDDTRAPSTPIEPAVVLLPDHVSGADDPFAWLSFQGRWGERQPSFNNGPTGPTTKDQWAHPIDWMETEGRTSSVSIPEAGTAVTDFFCRASTRGSLLFIAFLDRPYLIALAVVIVVGLIVLGIRRTRWKPSRARPDRRCTPQRPDPSGRGITAAQGLAALRADLVGGAHRGPRRGRSSAARPDDPMVLPDRRPGRPHRWNGCHRRARRRWIGQHPGRDLRGCRNDDGGGRCPAGPPSVEISAEAGAAKSRAAADGHHRDGRRPLSAAAPGGDLPARPVVCGPVHRNPRQHRHETSPSRVCVG